MHEENWCTVHCVFVNNPGSYFLLVPLKKEMSGFFNGNQGCFSFSGRVKGKALFPSQAFPLTMRTDFPISVHHLHAQPCGLGCHLLSRENGTSQKGSEFEPEILTFASCLWAQVGRKLPDAYQHPFFATSSKSVWANIWYQMLLEVTNL